MNRWTLIALLLMEEAAAVAYKWVDESGRVHYGDRPPAEREARVIDLPKGPSRQEIERARRLKETGLRKNRKFGGGDRPAMFLRDESQATKTRTSYPDKVACFAPLSTLVPGTSGRALEPIRPTTLSRAQQNMLTRLFSRTAGRWRGTISEVRCISETADPDRQIKNGKAESAVVWMKGKSQLTIETNYSLDSGRVGRIFHNLQVGNALFFIGSSTTRFAIKRNETEVLKLADSLVSFLTKWGLETRTGSRLGAQVRQLEIRGKALKVTELFYTQGKLSGAQTLLLSR